jgi:hypothetical protein
MDLKMAATRFFEANETSAIQRTGSNASMTRTQIASLSFEVKSVFTRASCAV